MAYGIMGSTRQSFMLSYQTTRSVRALYFDGESAALVGLGQLDTQMLHLYGNVTGPQRKGDKWYGMEPEYQRAAGLCDWLDERGLGGSGGIEGIVRMSVGFEIIWCHFGTESLRLVSRTNVTAPQTQDTGEDDSNREIQMVNQADAKVGRGDGEGPTSVYPLPSQPTRTDRSRTPTNPPSPPNWRDVTGPVEREPFLKSQGWGWFASATWHYGSSGLGPGKGETRARVLSCGIVSWYSPGFWGVMVKEEQERLNLTAEGYWIGEGKEQNRDLALDELGRRRRSHHLGGASEELAKELKRETEEMLRDTLDCSGMEWTGTLGEITQKIAWHLMAMEQTIRWAGDEGNVTQVKNWLYKIRGQSHIFLVSFLEYPHEIDKETWNIYGQLFEDTYSKCRYRYTRLLNTPLNSRESSLKQSAEEVMGGICGMLLEVGFEIEKAWYALEKGASLEIVRLSRQWRDGIKELRAWVGWEGEFIRCERVCRWDERCYVPMWPLVRSVRSGDVRPVSQHQLLGHSSTDWMMWRLFTPATLRGSGLLYGSRGTRLGRGPIWLVNETDLWQPKCIKMEELMPS